MSLSPVSATSSVVSQRRAIVVGAYGQDGRLLCAELENQHYEVMRIGRTTVCTGKDPTRPFDIRDAAAVDRAGGYHRAR